MSNENENANSIQARTEFDIIPVSNEGVDELFQQSEIAAHYQSIRESEEVRKKYDEMMETVIESCDDENFKDILRKPSVREKTEETMKDTLLIHALEKLVKEGKGDIQGAILSVITIDNILKQIDVMQQAWEETIKQTKGTGGKTIILGFIG